MKTIPILICGADPVGLSLSLALGRQGVNNLVVEQHSGTTIHPKARSYH